VCDAGCCVAGSRTRPWLWHQGGGCPQWSIGQLDPMARLEPGVSEDGGATDASSGLCASSNGGTAMTGSTAWSLDFLPSRLLPRPFPSAAQHLSPFPISVGPSKWTQMLAARALTSKLQAALHQDTAIKAHSCPGTMAHPCHPRMAFTHVPITPVLTLKHPNMLTC
jgi:hypothetical protein